MTRAAWGELFDAWRAGALQKVWAEEHPDLFDPEDLRVGISQPTKHFAEWYAAILLKRRHGWLSLVEKYGHHGHKQNPRKQAVLAQHLTAGQHRYVVTDPRHLFGHMTGWPDLFVYEPDSRHRFFCEVKGPTDSLSERQSVVFHSLRDETGIEVVTFDFRFGNPMGDRPSIGG